MFVINHQLLSCGYIDAPPPLFTNPNPNPNLPCTRPYFEMFHYVLSVAMGIRVQFLAEESSEIIPFAVYDLGGEDDDGGFAVTSTGMDVLKSLVHKLSDEASSVESTNYFQGHQFVPPPNTSEVGDLWEIPVLPLLKLLGVRHFLTVISAVLCEWRILFVSGSLQRLSLSVHAAVAAVNPLLWQHVFIPVLPAKLLDRVTAPMPFIIGLGKSLLSSVEKMALSSVLVINLDENRVFMSSGSFPPLLCLTRNDGGSKKNATKKIHKSYGKAINKLREKFVVDGESSFPTTNLNSDGHHHGHGRNVSSNNLMDNLCADIKIAHNRVEESEGGLMEDNYVSVTQEDIDLKTSLLAFFLCLLGDSKMLFPHETAALSSPSCTTTTETTTIKKQEQLRYDNEYFISQREEIGDPPLFLAFLNEFVHTRLFADHIRILMDLQCERSDTNDDSGDGSEKRKKSEPQFTFANTFFKCVNRHKACYCSSGRSAHLFSYSTAKRVVNSILLQEDHKVIDAVESSSSNIIAAGRNGERGLSPHRTSMNHILIPLLERGSIDVRHVQIAVRNLSSMLMDSREVKGIMGPLWSNLYAGSTGYDWRRTARTLYLLYELLIQGPDNVVADVLGHVPTLFRIAEVRRSHGASDREHEAVQGLGRRLLYALLDLRQLAWMRRMHRLHRTADSEQQRSMEVERFPFRGKPLEFSTLHSLVSDVMTDSDCKKGDVLFQTDYVNIMGKAPPPSPPHRPSIPLNIYSDDEGVWTEEEEEGPSPTSTPSPVVNRGDSDAAASRLISYQEDGYSPSRSQGQQIFSSSIFAFESGSNSEEGEDAAVDLSYLKHDEEEEGLKSVSRERQEERSVLGGWEAITVDVLTPTRPMSTTSPLVSSSVQGSLAAMAFGDGGGKLSHYDETLTPFNGRQQRNLESSVAAPLGTSVGAEQMLQVPNATDHQVHRATSSPPFYNNQSRLEVVEPLPYQQNHSSNVVELDNGRFFGQQLQLNQQQRLGRPAAVPPHTPPVGGLSHSSMVSSSIGGMSNQPPPPPSLSPVVQMEQPQQQQPSPYFVNSVQVSLPLQQGAAASVPPLKIYGDPASHQKPYIPQHVQQQQQPQQHNPGYVHEYSCSHHPVRATASSSSPIFIQHQHQQEVLGCGDHSRLTTQQLQNQNLSTGTTRVMPAPPAWQSQNVPSRGMIQQQVHHHQPPGPHPTTTIALPVQQQQQRQPHLTPTFQQLGQQQPPPPNSSVLPQHNRMPPTYVPSAAVPPPPPQEEQDSYPQIPQKQQLGHRLAPTPQMSYHQQHQQQFLPSGFVMPQAQNFGEQQQQQEQEQQPAKSKPVRCAKPSLSARF